MTGRKVDVVFPDCSTGQGWLNGTALLLKGGALVLEVGDILRIEGQRFSVRGLRFRYGLEQRGGARIELEPVDQPTAWL